MVPATILFIILFSYLNLTKYSVDCTSFSLKQKLSVVSAAKALSSDIDMRYDLPFGRESGIPMMLKKSGVKVSKDARTQVVVTESTADSIFIDGEIAKDIGRFGGFRVGYRVVQ